MAADRFSLVQATPYAWDEQHEVNVYVRRLSEELALRGHGVVVLAPSGSRELVRESRSAIAGLDGDARAIARPGEMRVLAVSQRVAMPPSARRGGTVSVPLDASRVVDTLLERAPFDFVHVHEPFAPSLASAALRHSRSLNVGTFHATTERVLSTQVARRFVELFFGRLDARAAAFRATADALRRFFPGDYEIVPPGADPPTGDPVRASDDVVDILFLAEEERGALRIFLRALRRLPPALPWRATIWSPVPAAPSRPLARAIRDRVRFAGPDDGSAERELARAHVVVAASTGPGSAPQLLLRAIAAGAVPIASRLPEYEELLRDGELGLLFEARDVDTLAGQMSRLIADSGLRSRFLKRAGRAARDFTWERAADRYEEIYGRVAALRHDASAGAAVRRRLERRRLIDVDLHMHTDHSPDCATPVETLLETARAVGLGAIAVTDHNEVSGALAARELAERDGYGVKVVVAEEVKTADQGEVIGLFLEEKIPRGMTLAETIAEIRRQGGLVYMPHPFDRMHAVPDYEHLLSVVSEIDAIEVYNARVAIASFNEEAARFAAKYRIPAGAGSDSHVPQGLGTVRIKMRDFDGPEEFLESLREADIVRRRQRLLYVQALKFIQTRAPGAAGRARRRAAGPPATSRRRRGSKS